MKILLTGANGFTGYHFQQAAAQYNYDIIPLTANLTDANALNTCVQQISPDAVVHLAGISTVHDSTINYYDVNVFGTLNLLNALCTLTNKPKHILLSSSANIYGTSNGALLTENTPPAPVNHYAMSKLAMEHMARTYLDRLPIFFVRPFNYTGPLQKTCFIIPKLIQHFIQRASSIELGDCTVQREFNDVRFVCEAYCQLLTAAAPGSVYNICTGKSIALHTVIERLQHLTGHNIEVKTNPLYLRSNEIQRLTGCPEKLFNTLNLQYNYSLDDTLKWMLTFMSEPIRKAQEPGRPG